MQNNCNSEEVVYAGFWVRLAAYLIDNIILIAGLFIVRLFLSGMMSLMQDTFLGGNLIFHYTFKDIVLYMFHILYFIMFTYYTGTTPGKRAMNLRVINGKATASLTLLDVLYRETVGRFLCSLTFGIGYIMAGIDGEKRGLHDILSDTRVIYAKRIKVYPVYPSGRGYGDIVRPQPQPGPYHMADSNETNK